MRAIFCGFTDPVFADHAAFGKNILHTKGLLTFHLQDPPVFPPLEVEL